MAASPAADFTAAAAVDAANWRMIEALDFSALLSSTQRRSKLTPLRFPLPLLSGRSEGCLGVWGHIENCDGNDLRGKRRDHDRRFERKQKRALSRHQMQQPQSKNESHQQRQAGASPVPQTNEPNRQHKMQPGQQRKQEQTRLLIEGVADIAEGRNLGFAQLPALPEDIKEKAHLGQLVKRHRNHRKRQRAFPFGRGVGHESRHADVPFSAAVHPVVNRPRF